MKKIIIATVLVISLAKVFAQEEEGVKLDLLKAPSSPASNLLGFATSEIDKPTDVSAFMLSLQNATSSFTKLPSNYAVDIAPYYLFPKLKGDLTTTGLQSQKFKDVFRQTFVLSVAVRNPDSTEKNFNPKSTYAGFGIKFSFVRGRYDDQTKNSLNQISAIQDIILNHLEEAAKKWRNTKDPEVLLLKMRREAMVSGKSDSELALIIKGPAFKELDSVISEKLSTFSDDELKEVSGELFDKIRKIAATFQTKRIGFTWDFNAGTSGEFLNKRFNQSKVYNAGVWTTIGYTDNKGSSFLGIARYLYNPDRIFAKDNAPNDIGNISTLDAGFKYAFSKSQSKFSCSLEAVYRSILSSDTVDPSWKLLFNADYAIWQNQKLTFSFGRDFDGTISKDGNLIAALTFLTGFGNKR